MERKQTQELVALQLIANESTPVGAARLEHEWRSHGIEKGEATAGRFLRQLDLAGFTCLQNRTRGRTLTPLGEDRLQDLQRAEMASHAEEALRTALDISNRDDLIELLEVRKLVECETARRAAIHATPADIRDLHALVTADCSATDETSMRESMAFHRAVAQASKSQLLIAFMNLLQDPTNEHLENALSQITRVSGITESLHHEHHTLVAAIENGLPDEASSIMETHFSRLISVASQMEQ